MYLVLRLIWVAQTVFLTAFLGVLFGLAVSAGVDWVRTRVRAPSRPASPRSSCLARPARSSASSSCPVPSSRHSRASSRRSFPRRSTRSTVGSEQGRFLGSLIAGSQGRRPRATRTPLLAAGARGPAPPAERDRTGAAPAPDAHRQRRLDRRARLEGGRGGQAPPQTLKQRIIGQLAGLTRYLFGFLSSTDRGVRRAGADSRAVDLHRRRPGHVPRRPDEALPASVEEARRRGADRDVASRFGSGS